jgi:NADPH2:quinone reductase
VMPLFASGTISPLIHSTFPLSNAAEAHELMENGGHFGKIVLLP